MRARRALILVALITIVVALGPAAWSQQIPRATCLDCHEAEGMRYAVLQPTPYLEIPQGQTQTFNVTVANPWLHEITSTLVTVDLTNASTVTFETPDPLNLSRPVNLSPADDTATVPFKVQPGATGAVVRMTQPQDQSGVGAVDVDTRLEFPDAPAARAPPDGSPNQTELGGELRQPGPANTVEQYAYEGDTLATKGTGTWNLTLKLANGPPDTTAQVEVKVFYNTTRTLTRLHSETIAPGKSAQVPFKIMGTGPGPANVQVSAIVTSYYEHPTGIGAQDEGNATMTDELNFTVGESLELGDAGPAVPPTPPISWKLNARIWGEATGFIGLFMIPLSLLLGGAFGRRNVLWANKVTGSARLRVLWHNSLSFFLLGISLLHLVLFLYEEVYDWSVGMVWGGIGTLALIGLGITGGFQRWFAREMGYNKWRLLHIAMAVTFVASVLVHVLVDGAHFDIFREWLNLT